MFLNTKFQLSNNNKVSISRNDLSEIKLTEKELIQSVYLLEADGLFDVIRKSVHDDLSMPCTLALKSSCIHYFEKNRSKIISKREWVRTYIPVVLSAIAIILSIISLIK